MSLIGSPITHLSQTYAWEHGKLITTKYIRHDYQNGNDVNTVVKQVQAVAPASEDTRLGKNIDVYV